MDLPCDQVMALITAKLANGVLRSDAPAATSTAVGSDRACAGCDRPIGPGTLECACRFSDGSTLHFHLACFTGWRLQQRG